MSQRLISISYLRALSALLIFLCHVAFIAGAFEASMWLNVGVPIFFIISAYLLSLKNDISKEPKTFYRRRFVSIFPSYWIYLACVICILFVVGRAPDLKSMVYFGLGLSGLYEGNILGLGHLWFITVLLICYICTPALHYICQRCTRRELCLSLSILIVVQFVIFFLLKHPSYGIHVGTYVLVYCYYNRHNGVVSFTHMAVWCSIAFLASLTRVFFDKTFIGYSPSVYYYYDALFLPTARFTLAMAFFTIFIYCSEWIEVWSEKNPHTHVVISKFSGISYEVYLTHQFILLAFWEFIPALHKGFGMIIWIIVSFVVTIINSFILVYFRELNNKVIKRTHQ